MKRVFFIILLLSAWGCCGPKHIPHTTETVQVIEHTQIVPVAAEWHFPELSTERQTRDTASHLENRFAESDAVVSEGELFHSLRTKPQTIEVQTQVVVEWRDSIVYKETVIEKEVPVEKPLNWWQKFRIRAFWWLVGIALVGWRREIISLIKSIIKLF